MNDESEESPRSTTRARRPGPLIRPILRAPALLYKVGAGRLLGHRFTLLTHRGRKSGQLHRTVLEVVRWDEREEAVVMSGWGPRSNWYLNVRAGGAEWIEIGGASFSPEIRFPEEEEAITILTAYEGRNRITAGLLGSILSRQAGFDYDGSPAARERLVRELPLVAFARPM